MPQRIYLDHAATTPILPAARAAVAEAMARWANPSSAHKEGRAAHAALEEARARIKAALGWDGAIVFTSGATEAIEIVMRRAKAGARIVSQTEHSAVLRAVPDPVVVSVQPHGILDLCDLDMALTGRGRTLVAVQSVNNETGVIQPMARIAEQVRESGGLLLADCAQSAGKLPLPEADFIAVSAHKLGGPPGIGALLVRDEAQMEAVGGQEGGQRAGTVPVPLILGFAAALEADRAWLGAAEKLRERLDGAIAAAGGEAIAAAAPRIPTIASYRMPGVPGAAQLIQFDLAGIAVSAGSACASGSVKPSHVLAAMGMEEGAAREAIRASFGPGTSEREVDAFAAAWRALFERRRAA